ncbi:MAG: hypothetical protein J1F63_03230 [Oscillospiraceae bacterium]|nr:hypothetical protein [Oscillospiraceae bacterium]
MKKLIPIFAAMFILIIGGAALADEPVMEGAQVLDASQNPTINYTQKGEGGLPYLTCNYIIYVPLDEYHTNLLGLSVTETENAVTIDRLPDNGEYRYIPKQTEKITGGAITEVNKNLVLVGDKYENSYYKLARYGNVLYLPLSWEHIQRLGISLIDPWCTNWNVSVKNISVYSDSRFYTTESGGEWMSGWYSNTDYYLVSGVSAARVSKRNRRFFSDIELYYSCRSDEFIEFTNKFFPEFYEKGLEIEGDTLLVDGGYFTWRPDHYGSTPSELYRLEIDLPSGELIDAELLKRNVYDPLYGGYEDESGNIDQEILYTNMFGEPSYFYYDGGHVILNGTMMRSYTGFVYKVHGRNDDGQIMSSGASASSYWIRVEDLENYGYDMVTDFIGHATYFTRNPNKAITPLGFEGNSEHLPIYESDWKIYIDNVEPKQYFNIGGYTMVNSGELGEYEEGELDPGYRVRYVTTEDMVIHEQKIVGYYSVDVFDEPLEELHTEYLTDVMYAFVLPKADGSLEVPRPDVLRQVVEKAHNDGAKVHASIGGYGTPEQNILLHFINTASDEQKTRRFIESAVWMVREYDLDGIEIDWEHPTDDTKDLFESFIHAVCSDPRLPSVSAALCGCFRDGTPIYASAAVNDGVLKDLDFIDIMAYDENLTDHSTYEFAESSMNYWLSRGVPAEKLILGIPLYSQPSFWQYRHLHEAGYDILHSDYADTPYSPSYYNSLDTIKRKLALAKSVAGGVMFFDVHEDTNDETSAVKAAWEALQR